MKPALLLIDLQQDFLARKPLSPPATSVVQKTGILLEKIRSLDIPVLHVQTIVRPDGSDQMVHWHQKDISESLDWTSFLMGHPGGA